MQDMPFTSAEARNKFIVDNAEYFTVILRSNRRNYRSERKALAEATELAEAVLKKWPESRLMIYAVLGDSSTLTATVSSEGIKRHK